MSRIDALGVARELRRGVDLGRIGDVDQVMRDAALLVERHLVGADVEAAIDGGGIAVDDLAAEAARPAPDPARSSRTRSARARPGREASSSKHANEHVDDERGEHEDEARAAAYASASAVRRQLHGGCSL